ncbi:hypothetical protein BDV39DRAFT_209087 [Aspergillus sergii]|uniref:Uncharacterized protein n=1 Tax=Aspergillus sergii TaxID=1034303 RepID=A0A5N6WQL7_9EURO|nr:hypothetical protein BDV39DRAFT_209087 [Aspergillus sergii]
MNLQNYLFSLLISSIPTSITAQSNPDITASCAYPAPNTCTFYPSCLERVYHCGDSGYPLAFGNKYCTKTLEYRSLLSPAGQSWSTNAMLCLQEQLVPLLPESANQEKDCHQLERYAMATHANCFVQSGVCSLGLKDWEVIVEIIWPALLSEWRTWVSAVETAEECIGFTKWLALWHLS